LIYVDLTLNKGLVIAIVIVDVRMDFHATSSMRGIVDITMETRLQMWVERKGEGLWEEGNGHFLGVLRVGCMSKLLEMQGIGCYAY
jgi:hypothetical protein